MQESLCKSVWLYAFQSEGSNEEWAVQQICDHLETVDLKNDRIVVKSIQDHLAFEMSSETACVRASDHGTAVENPAVGQSDTNATMERAIQDVQGQVRTLTAVREQNFSSAVRLGSPMVPLLV